MPRPSKNRPTVTQGGGLALGACLGMKNIGKPCAGKPHARFDEGGQVTLTNGIAIEAPPDERGGNR